MGDFDSLNLSGSRDLRGLDTTTAINKLQSELAAYQATEEKLLDTLTKKRLAQEELVRATQIANIEERQKAEQKARRKIKKLDSTIEELRTSQEEYIAKRRVSNLTSYANKYKRYLQDLAAEEENKESELQDLALDRLQKIHSTQVRMQVEYDNLERDNLIRRAGEAESSFKKRAGKSTTLQLQQLARIEAVNKQHNKNAVERAEWLVNQEEIKSTTSALRHEQRAHKLHETKVALELAKADEEQYIIDTLEQRETDSADRIYKERLALAIQERDFKAQVLRDIENASIAAEKRIAAAKAKFALYSADADAGLTDEEKDARALARAKLTIKEIEAINTESKSRVAELGHTLEVKTQNKAQAQVNKTAEKAIQNATELFDLQSALDQEKADKAMDQEQRLKKFRIQTEKELFDARKNNEYTLANIRELADAAMKKQAAAGKNKSAEAKLQTQTYTTYSEEDIKKVRGKGAKQKKAAMRKHNNLVQKAKKADSTAAYDSKVAEVAKQRYDTEVRIEALKKEGSDAALTQKKAENMLLDEHAKALSEANDLDAKMLAFKMESHDTELQNLKDANALKEEAYSIEKDIAAERDKARRGKNKESFNNKMYGAVQKADAKKENDMQEAWMAKLNAKPGDANFTQESIDYQAKIDEAKEKARAAAGEDSDGNIIDQKKYDEILKLEMKMINEKYNFESQAYKDFLAEQEKEEAEARALAIKNAPKKALEKKAEAAKKKKEETISDFKTAFNPAIALAALSGDKDAKGAIKNSFNALTKDENGKFSIAKTMQSVTSALSGLLQTLNTKMDEIGRKQAPIDTRLYGSSANFQNTTAVFTALAGASPVLLQSDMMASLEKLVGQGISHNIQLRAFLDTASQKIATTFDVADATLLRLVRIQQQDTTMARLGMESALNAFLNNMFETTEYLTSLADSVRQNLYEAQALMGAKEATEFEYQVQKWLGSMHSVGMSDESVSKISTALGQLASGQIEALTGGGAGNLMVMAANSAGISLGEILSDGLDATKTNELLEATVGYLKEIADRSESKVVQQQLANIFGVTAADLKAIGNLANDGKTVKNIAKNKLDYGGMVGETVARSLTMATRTSMGEMLANVWDNVQYSLAAGMAANPVSYLLFKMSNLLEESTGGIDLPFLNVYGFGVDLNTSVAQLMQIASMAGGLMGTLGTMMGGLANTGTDFLSAMGASADGKLVSRGTGETTAATSGAGASASGLVGNGSGADMQAATMAQAADDIASIGQQGKEENEDATRDDIIEVLKMLFGDLGMKIDLTTAAVKLGAIKIAGGNVDMEALDGFTKVDVTTTKKAALNM